MGTYPSFAFTPSDDAVIVWAAGQIYSVPLSTNERGEKVASSTPPSLIRFIAHIEKKLAETLRGGVDVLKLETQDTQRVRALKELRVDDHGERAVFQAAGVSYLQKIGKKDALKVPVLHKLAPYYSPSFIHGADNLIIHARWSDTNFSSFEISNVKSGVAHELVGVPLGRYFSPVLCECDSSHRQIAFVKSGGDYMTGDIVATAGTGLYVGDISLPADDAKAPTQITIQNIRLVLSDIDSDDRVNMRFLEKNKKLLVQQSTRAFVIDLGAGPNKFGEYQQHTLASGRMSSELVVSPLSGNAKVENVAFVDFFHVYFAPGTHVKNGESVWSKPGNATKGLVRLSLDGGHDVTFSRDGKRVLWFLGTIFVSWSLLDLLTILPSFRTFFTFFGDLQAWQMFLRYYG